MALEMMTLQNLNDVDAILTTVSGGGLASGISISAKAINNNNQVILVKTKSKKLTKSLKNKYSMKK